MKKKNEDGIAIIMVLVLAAVLMISLTAAISTLHAIHTQNSKMKKELRHQAHQINSQK